MSKTHQVRAVTEAADDVKHFSLLRPAFVQDADETTQLTYAWGSCFDSPLRETAVILDEHHMGVDTRSSATFVWTHCALVWASCVDFFFDSVICIHQPATTATFFMISDDIKTRDMDTKIRQRSVPSLVGTSPKGVSVG